MVTRPAAVTVVAISLLAATAIALVTGATLLLPGTGLDALWQLNEKAHSAFIALGRVSGAFLVLLACVTSAAGLGLFRGRRWAWRTALSIFFVSGLGDLFTLLSTGDWLRGGSGVLVAGVFSFFLLRPNVRTFFFGHG